MDPESNTRYGTMSDKDIVDLVVEGNEEAMLYLIYDRYDCDVKFYAWRYFGSFAFLEDLISDLYLQFKGKKGDWQPLRSFQWRCIFRTWFCSVTSHLFIEKRKELIGLGTGKDSIVVSGTKLPDPEPEKERENHKLVMILEAISRLENDDYRFILGLICGNILGLVYGYEALPFHFKDQVELADIMTEVAEDLWNGCPAADTDPEVLYEWKRKYLLMDKTLSLILYKNNKRVNYENIPQLRT